MTALLSTSSLEMSASSFEISSRLESTRALTVSGRASSGEGTATSLLADRERKSPQDLSSAKRESLGARSPSPLVQNRRSHGRTVKLALAEIAQLRRKESWRLASWRMYLRKFELDEKQTRPDDVGWTGAEIRSCCRLAALLDVPLVAAAQNGVPIAKTSSEAVEQLRSGASGRCLSADLTGIKPGWKLSRDRSNN